MSEATISFPSHRLAYAMASCRALAIAFVLILSVLQAWPVKRLVRPFAPLFDKLGMGQRWNLFTSTGPYAYQLQIEGLRGDQSARLLYRSLEQDVLGLVPRLTYRRLRAIYDPRSKKVARAQYEPFAQWLAEEILAAHAEYVGVRVSVRRLRLSGEQLREVASIEHVVETYRPGTP
jgi:hypothetical protein